jgi:hypothetical protein
MVLKGGTYVHIYIYIYVYIYMMYFYIYIYVCIYVLVRIRFYIYIRRYVCLSASMQSIQENIQLDFLYDNINIYISFVKLFYTASLI